MKFLNYFSTGSVVPKVRKEIMNMSPIELKQWLYQNLTVDQITDLCVGLIQEDINTPTVKPITISQEEFEQHFRIRKPQENPARNKQ